MKQLKMSEQIQNTLVGLVCIAAVGYLLYRLIALLRGKSASGCSKCSGSSNGVSGTLVSPQPSKELHQITSSDDDV
ncbi:MAG: FeoB-associated Cys-rich membrane protein [Planctomycetes bacterium]|nr:FeoB-associated Cys-rich membrane protein [Planctomycetota bacterium]